MIKVSFIFVASLIMISCAGPMTPFGAKDNYLDNHHFSRHVASSANNVSLKFHPESQLYHKSYPLRMEIRDKFLDRNNFEFHVLYNNHLVDKDLLSTKFNKDLAVVSFNKLKLAPSKDHVIKVIYKSYKNGIVVKEYKTPKCHLYQNRKISSVDGFDVDESKLKLVRSVANKHNLNEGVLASLVAQESSFNSKAVSYAKAIGLTQVTSIAEEEFIHKYPKWPRYPGIRNMNYRTVRSKILRNKINSSNEWRLNDKYSLIGGAEYLNYLTGYWFQADSLHFLNNHLSYSYSDIDLILASYNSGIGNVRKGIKANGNKWLNSSNLKEAKKYVNKINSICVASQSLNKDEYDK